MIRRGRLTACAARSRQTKNRNTAPRQTADCTLRRVSDFLAAEAILREGIAARAFPGASYAVLHGGNVLLGAAGRFTYLSDARKVTIETIYDLASLTKV